jgi:hypothetical protein
MRAFTLVTVLLFSLGLNVISVSYSEQSPRILGSVSYIYSVDSVRFFVVEGVVYNALAVNVKVNVSAAFYDLWNVSIGTAYSGTSLKILRPGQKSPFTIYFVLDSSEVYRYELSLSYVETDEQPFDVFEFRNVENRSEDSRLMIVGELWNGRPFKALNVGVVCICYDSSGDFCGLYRNFVQSIGPGASTNFTIEIDEPLFVAHFDLVAYAGGYEYLSIPNVVLFAFLVLIFVVFLVFMKKRGW